MKKQTKKAVAVIAATAMLTGFVAPLAKPVEVHAFEQAVKQSQKRNVMYYGDWSIWGGQGNFYPKDIPAEQLTHLNFAFMDFDSNGDLVFTDEDAAVGAPVGQPGVQWQAPNAGVLIALQELRAKNPNMKIGISLGGWSKSGDFSEVAANPSKRANFVKNVMKFIEYTNMDFVDLDWEYPADVRQPDLVDNKNDEGAIHSRPEDKQNYITLLQDLRTALDKQGTELGKKYELSVALPAPKAKVDLGIDVDALFHVVDFANIMTYDMRGAWDDVSGHQTGLYPNPNEPQKGNNLSVDESVDYLISKGAEPEKIVIGAAYYTRGWNKVDKGPDANLPGLFGKAEKNAKDADQTPSYGAANEAPLSVGDGGRRSGVWSYRSIDKLKSNYPGLKEYWDDTAKAPYLYDANTGMFFTYDNVRSIGEKTKYVNEHDLGGVIAWMASQDKPTTDPNKRDELTKATKEGLFGNAALPKYEIKSAALDVATSVNKYEEAWGNNKGYEITVKNNEVLQESSKVLKAVEKGAETIKAPKLYIKGNAPFTSGDYTAGTVTYENGYTVVDLKSVWEGKNIEPGQSYKFKLKGDGNIESIELVQRMSDASPDMNRQTIYGKTTGEPEANTAPTLTGVANKTIQVGDAFDALAGVSASDKEDGNITPAIKVTGTVDTTKAGTYTLTYSVSDSKGLTTTVDRKITVEEKTITPPPANEAPTLAGVGNKEITVGGAFDVLAGVSASDKEDGNITSAIKVTGTVDTTKAGTYTLTYSVTDSKGATTVATRVITVKEKPPVSGDTFDPTKVYLAGDVVIYKGEKYKAKWWTQGGVPENNQAWEKVVTPNEDGSMNYVPGTAYVGGNIVTYNGVKYKAKWWTTSTPGSDDSWEKL